MISFDILLISLQETFGIMGEPATAMRDPIFYRFHAFVDDVFLEHKNTLPEYTLQQVHDTSSNEYVYCESAVKRC